MMLIVSQLQIQEVRNKNQYVHFQIHMKHKMILLILGKKLSDCLKWNANQH